MSGKQSQLLGSKTPIGAGAFIGSAVPVVSLDGATYLRSGVIAVRSAYPNVPADIYSSGVLNLPPSSAYASAQYYCAAYGNGTYVLLNNTANSGNVMMSVDGGNTWTSRALPSTVTTWGGSLQSQIAFGAGLFVVIAGVTGGNTLAWTSPDAINWTARTLPSSTWGGVFYVGGIFVACGLGIVATSPDGITWTSRTCTGSSMADKSIVSYADVDGVGTYLMMNANATPAAAKSVNGGVTWTVTTVPPAAMVYPGAMTVDPTGKVFTYYSSSTQYYRSLDGGVSWLGGTPTGDTISPYNQTWLDGYLYAAPFGTTSVAYRSIDGMAWKQVPLAISVSSAPLLMAGPHRLVIAGFTKAAILSTDVVGIDTYTPNLYMRVE